MRPPPLPRSSVDTSPGKHAASPVEDALIRELHETKSLEGQNPRVAEPDDYLHTGELMQKVEVLRLTNVPPLPAGRPTTDMTGGICRSTNRIVLGISI